MTALPPLAINGKFLAAPPTGVHRVAAELTHALAAYAETSGGALDIELWVPQDAAEAAKSFSMRTRVITPLTHIPWEQLSVPLRDGRRTLLNLCNIGPALRSNAVTMIHDAQVFLTPQSYSRPFRLWYKSIQPLIARRHRHLLTVSEYSRQEIARAGLCPAERISVIHNGVDHILKVEPSSSIVVHLGLIGKPYVVALASTQSHKNIALLTRAFALPELASIQLILVGGSSRADFAAHGIDLPDNVTLAGRISDGELRALYERALCVAFPSRTEGFGLPPLEAMLLGCPALVAPCGALPEVCGDAALYADPDDAAGWAALIRKFAQEPDWRNAYAARGKAQASRFTWNAAAANLLDVLARVAIPAGAPTSALSTPSSLNA